MASAKTKPPAPPEAPDRPTAEELADAIRAIAAATDDMLTAGLNRRALVVLLKDSSGVSIGEIEKVLNALKYLERDYTTKRGRA